MLPCTQRLGVNTTGTKASLFLFFPGCDERKTTCLKPSLVRQIYLSMNGKKCPICSSPATLWYCHNKKLKKSEIYECKQGEAAV